LVLSVHWREHFVCFLEGWLGIVITDGSDESVLSSGGIFAKLDEIGSHSELVAVELDDVGVLIPVLQIVPLSQLDLEVLARKDNIIEGGD
jgi:hypothetical protein